IINYHIFHQYEIFFYSSRRRHTRSKRDWSSDVCSSDLIYPSRDGAGGTLSLAALVRDGLSAAQHINQLNNEQWNCVPASAVNHKIGRASCRERVLTVD